MKLRLDRGVIRWWLMAAGVLLAWPNLLSASIGTALIGLGMVVHLWAKGCLQQNRQLTVCGPYRWSRNPFYVANFLIDYGLCLLINNIWLTGVFLVAWAWVYRKQIAFEEATLEGIYGQAWQDYKKAVPVFVPYKRPYSPVPPEQGFSWANPNLSQSREIPRLLRTATYPLMLLVAGHVGPMMWIHLHKSGLSWTANFSWLLGAAGMACLAGIVALQGFAAALKQQLHKRQPVLPTILRRSTVQLALLGLYLLVLTVITTGAAAPNRVLMGSGAAMLLMGFAALEQRRKDPGMLWDAVAWCAALGGAGLLASLPWAAVLAVAAALAICIDSHIGAAWSLNFPDVQSLTSEQAPPKALWDRLGVMTNYTLFILLLLAIATSRYFVLKA